MMEEVGSGVSRPFRVLLNNQQVQCVLANVIQGRSSSTTVTPAAAPPSCEYSYKVKILQPSRKKSSIVRHLHEFNEKFVTVEQIKEQVHRELEEVPIDSVTEVGYFEGRQSSKIWMITDKDVASMYNKVKKDAEIFLWIQISESDSEDENEPVRKKRRSQKEEEIEEIYQKLKKKHEGEYSYPQLKLWARMLKCGTYDDYDTPPQVPMITGTVPKPTKKDSFAQALTGAAEAVVKALSPSPTPVSPEPPANIGISPGKSTKLRSENYQQLRDIKRLYDEGIFSESELAEQKATILSALRKLS